MVNPSFSLHLWCRLLLLAITTLNLLRLSQINPKLSAYKILNDTFDYNKTLIAPLGCKVIVYEATVKRGTWDLHGLDGWYSGIAPEHYYYYKVYILQTRAEYIVKSVYFFLYKAPIL